MVSSWLLKKLNLGPQEIRNLIHFISPLLHIIHIIYVNYKIVFFYYWNEALINLNFNMPIIFLHF